MTNVQVSIKVPTCDFFDISAAAVCAQIFAWHFAQLLKIKYRPHSFWAQSWRLIAVNQSTLSFVTYSVKYFFSLTVPFIWFHLILCNTDPLFSSPAIPSICKTLKLCPFGILFKIYTLPPRFVEIYLKNIKLESVQLRMHRICCVGFSCCWWG